MCNCSTWWTRRAAAGRSSAPRFAGGLSCFELVETEHQCTQSLYVQHVGLVNLLAGCWQQTPGPQLFMSHFDRATCPVNSFAAGAAPEEGGPEREVAVTGGQQHAARGQLVAADRAARLCLPLQPQEHGERDHKVPDTDLPPEQSRKFALQAFATDIWSLPVVLQPQRKLHRLRCAEVYMLCRPEWLLLLLPRWQVDWNKLEADLKEEEKKEVLDGDAGVHKLFRDIYSGALLSKSLRLHLPAALHDITVLCIHTCFFATAGVMMPNNVRGLVHDKAVSL